ncbi:MAG: ABC transporter permease [Burkholderiales bacterium]
MNSESTALPGGSLSSGRNIWQLLDKLSGLIYFLVLLLLFVIIKPGALTPGSASTLLQLSIPLLVVATGMTFCLVCGEVDLSVAGVCGLTSTVIALQLDHGAGWPTAVCLGLGVGFIVGMINGALTAYLASSFPRFPSFLVTLATLSITLGAAQALQPMQQPIAINDPEFKNIFGFTDSVLGSYPTWYAVIVVAVAYLILTRSRVGYAMYAVGTNPRAARLVGFGVLRTKFWVLTASGLLAAFGGILMAGYVQAGFHVIATGIEVDAIAAAVIGGTALFGGRGTVLGTIVGVLTLGLLNTGLLIMEIHVNGQLMIKGALVILALVIGEYVRERAVRS